jgi:F0F1-type ATP synthase assembly protein I
MPDKRDPFLMRSLQQLQDNIRRAGPAATASYSLIGSIMLFGGGGFLIDRWQDTSPWFLLIGLLMGIIVGFYQLAKTVWKS